MCNFCSWIESKAGIFYLNNDCLKTPKGEKLIKYLGDTFSSEIVGHGAIIRYHNRIYNGKHKEVNNLRNPNSIPKQIVSDIKRLKMTKIIEFVPGLLNKKAYNLYIKKTQKARLEFNEKLDSYRKDYYYYKKTHFSLTKSTRHITTIKNKELSKVFWGLFRLKKNRSKAWR